MILRKKFTFEASHQLMNHDGKCRRLHGHSWVMWVEIIGNEIQSGEKENMLMDYTEIKKIVNPLVGEVLDHHHLNDTLLEDMPTSEYLAMFVFKTLKPDLPLLNAIEIEETCTSMCRYEG